MARHYLALTHGNPSEALRMLAADRCADLDSLRRHHEPRRAESEDPRG